jgi:hypothetical protein
MMQRFFFLICVCLLAACSSLQGSGSGSGSSGPSVPSVPDESKLVLDAIAYAQRVASASADDQRREMSAAAQALTRERSTSARLRYGVLLSLPALPTADAQRASTTLEPLSTASGNGAVRQFSLLLLTQINERQKEQRRAQQFKEQLDELRAIERTLIERGQPKK